MLQVIISPAKQMRTAQDAFEVLGIPPYVRETARLSSGMKAAAACRRCGT